MANYLLIFSDTVLFLVFAVSAYAKLRRRAAVAAFVAGVREMRLVPPAATPAVASVVIAAEVAIPLLIGVSWTGGAGLVLAAALLGCLTVAILVVLRRGTSAACPCFGASAVTFGARHVVRNGLLLAVVGLGLLAHGYGTDGVDPGGVAVAGAAAVAVVALIVSWEDIVEVLLPRRQVGRR